MDSDFPLALVVFGIPIMLGLLIVNSCDPDYSYAYDCEPKLENEYCAQELAE